MVAFDPTRATPVARGRNGGMNVGNVAAESKGTVNGDHGSGSTTWRKM